MNPHNIHQNPLTLRMWIIWIHEFPYEFDVPYIRKMPERKFLTSNPTRHNAGTYKVGHSSAAWALLERGLHFWSQTFGLSQLWQFDAICPEQVLWTWALLGHIFHLRHFSECITWENASPHCKDFWFFYGDTWDWKKWNPTTPFRQGFFSHHPLLVGWSGTSAHLPKETNF